MDSGKVPGLVAVGKVECPELVLQLFWALTNPLLGHSLAEAQKESRFGPALVGKAKQALDKGQEVLTPFPWI